MARAAPGPRLRASVLRAAQPPSRADASSIQERATSVALLLPRGSERLNQALDDARLGRGPSVRRRAIEARSRSRIRDKAAATRRLPLSMHLDTPRAASPPHERAAPIAWNEKCCSCLVAT